MMILAPLAAMLLQLGLSRQREYSADQTGARMVGNPYGLISALQKLGGYNNRIPTTAISPSTSSLCIVKPLFRGGSLGTLFSTHPPLADRIAALRETTRSEEHTSELQSRLHLVCRLLLEKKKTLPNMTLGVDERAMQLHGVC